ncbi:PKD domain-containing protein, partial [Flavivirga algicola]
MTQKSHLLFFALITSCYSLNAQFITTWQTTVANQRITIPTKVESTYNYTVDWGDGSLSTNQTGDATHTYTKADTYTVTVTGDFPRIYFNNEGSMLNIQSIEQWGSQTWTSMGRAFYGC